MIQKGWNPKKNLRFQSFFVCAALCCFDRFGGLFLLPEIGQKKTGKDALPAVCAGVHGGSRTPGLPLRRRSLYPSELRRLTCFLIIIFFIYEIKVRVAEKK
jgi:hypothetical protein